MSFFKKLFGGAPAAPKGPMESLRYEGYEINTMPAKEGGQYRLSGTISKEINGEIQTHHLIRADLFISADECSAATLRKAQQVINEQGDRLFG